MKLGDQQEWLPRSAPTRPADYGDPVHEVKSTELPGYWPCPTTVVN